MRVRSRVRAGSLRGWGAAVAAGLLCSCAGGPDYVAESAPALGVPQDWSVPAEAGEEDLAAWWRRFEDPVLTLLVEQALGANLTIDQAAARLRQAREALVASRAALLPSLGASGSYSRSDVVSGAGGGSQAYALGLDASYQVDLFGGNRRAVEANRADLEAAGFDYASTMRAVESELARNYVLARSYQAQLANARASLAIQDDNLEIAGWRVMAGLVSSVDKEQARASRAQAAATIPQIEQQYNAAVSRIAVLTGRAPGALKPIMTEARAIPAGPVGVGAGIPADILRRRPDVRAAERALAAAFARIGVAKAQLYPSLSIGGSLDTAATGPSRLFDTITGGLFASVAQSLFAGGRLSAEVRSSQAAADGAFAAYKQAVLTALEDVENALAAFHAAETREKAYAEALDAAQSSAIYARAQYRSGLTDFTTLNTQEAALVSARNGLVQAESDRASALIALFDALGGGWNPDGVVNAIDAARTAPPTFTTTAAAAAGQE